MGSLGRLYTQQDRPAEAEAAYRRALALAQQHFPDGNPDVADVPVGYAALLRQAGRAATADEHVALAATLTWPGVMANPQAMAI